ncbi:MAG: sensor histidine kinase KdpD [Thermacetogeniaceae bacterium]
MSGNAVQAQGILTVFLGAAAGVGKTYAMLEMARTRMMDTTDVVAGWVETHGRPETEALLDQIPAIAPRSSASLEKDFAEMDLDGILRRRPKIVLVDELAHVNLAGARHARRYQDVEELLAAGIDVYTTMSIMHLESLNDMVARITGMVVHETVPDRILEQAVIQVVDITPEELMQRLKEGKIHFPEGAAEEMRKFFRPGNINALRELALRQTARGVDRQLETYMQKHAINGPWPAGERVMICISSSPFATQLIRIGSRLADSLQAEWMVVHVDTLRSDAHHEAAKNSLNAHFHLAEELGAETMVLPGNDVAEELLRVARKRNVTHIVIGKPLRSRLGDFLHGPIVDKVIRGSTGIGIHIYPGESQHFGSEGKVFARKSFSAASYAWIALMVLALTILLKPLSSLLGQVNIAMLYLLPVLFSAVIWGPGYAALAAVLGMLAFDFFFVPPTFSFLVANIHYVLSFIVFLLVALMTGTISGRLRQHVTHAQQREARTAALYALSRAIAATNEMGQVLEHVAKKVAEIAESQVAIWLPDEQGILTMRASAGLQQKADPDESESPAPRWAFEHGMMAGSGTETLAWDKWTYVPLQTEQGTAGVLAVKPQEGDRFLTSERRQMLDAFASLAAVGINRIQLVERARAADLLKESDRLHTALFNSISHELRTPLASIMGAVTGLLDDNLAFSTPDRADLLLNIKQGALRMNRLVNNLLDMARLESGYLRLKMDWCDVQDIVGVAIRRCDTARPHPLKVDIEWNLPLIQVDFVLIEQVIVNLLDNAAKYSPPNETISIRAHRKDGKLEFTVVDSGPGIPDEDKKLIFDKFYRLRTSHHVGGTGLGLTICKGIIEAHGGEIWAEDNENGGTALTFALPLDDVLHGHAPEINAGDGDGD